MRILLTLLLLAGCVTTAPVQQPTFCDCAPVTTDEMSIAATGFPNAAIISQDGYSAPEADGTTHKFVQFDTTLATPAQIAAAPAALCASQELTLVSSQIVAPGPDDFQAEDSMFVRAICQ